MKAIVCFARMNHKSQSFLYSELKKNGIEIVGVSCYGTDADIVKNLLPNVEYAPWTVNINNYEWSDKLRYESFKQFMSDRYEFMLPLSERYGEIGTGSMIAYTKLALSFSRVDKFLNKTKPDLILNGKIPEIDFPNILHMEAKNRGIINIYTRFGLFNYSKFVSKSWREPLMNSDLSYNKNSIILKNNIKEISSKSKKCINEIKNAKYTYIPAAEWNKLDVPSFHSTIKSLLFTNNIKSIPRVITSKEDGLMLKRRLLTIYQEIQNNKENNNNNILYFPLHYQPELTTMPRGQEYWNQLITLKLLSDNIPKDFKIYVKEHRAIFSNNTYLSKSFRNKEFYQYLKTLYNVEIRPINESSIKLIDKCVATITVTGTAGFESILRGKPVICFGSAPYENAPGVFRVRKYDDISKYIKIICSDSEKFNVDQEKLVEYIRRYESVCFVSKSDRPNDLSKADIWHQGIMAETLALAAEEYLLND